MERPILLWESHKNLVTVLIIQNIIDRKLLEKSWNDPEITWLSFDNTQILKKWTILGLECDPNLASAIISCAMFSAQDSEPQFEIHTRTFVKQRSFWISPKLLGLFSNTHRCKDEFPDFAYEMRNLFSVGPDRIWETTLIIYFSYFILVFSRSSWRFLVRSFILNKKNF